MNQPLDLDQIEARRAAASKGPWSLSEDYNDIHNAEGDHVASYWHTADGEFIAYAPDDIDAMAVEIRRLRARVTELEGEQQPRCGRTRSIDGGDYPPCARREGHRHAYCRSADGRAFFLAVDADQPKPAAAQP
jgi:hypothetical protein